jgi:N-acetylmuramoyl-L-alanine amidase
MLLKYNEDCETRSVIGLDRQLIYQMNKIAPDLLVRIDDIPNLILGSSVLPWLQATAKKCLIKAIELRRQKEPDAVMTINSAYRTIVAQQLLRFHFECGRCGIVAAAPPGMSNHNGAYSIDIEDSAGWRPYLLKSGWKWLGAFDPMHYDCTASGIIAGLNTISVRAFQQIYNLANPHDILATDGDIGQLTLSRLRFSPIEGFPLPPEYPARILKLTEPLQAGNDVGMLQLQLRAAGIALEKADKIFGESTDKAVRKFQTASGMTADGIAGKSTTVALLSATARTA